MMHRFTLYRWWKRTQLDVQLGRGYLSLGVDRRPPVAVCIPWRPIAYYSPDATPAHPRARGLNGWSR